MKIDHKKTTPSERLEYIRKKIRLTRTNIEKRYGLSAATLKFWEKGKLSEKGLKRCIDIYRKEGVILSKEWIMTGNGLPPKLAINVGKYFASELQYPTRETKNNKIKDKEPTFPYIEDDNACILREAGFFKEFYLNTKF